jgi:hypothetical protein
MESFLIASVRAKKYHDANCLPIAAEPSPLASTICHELGFGAKKWLQANRRSKHVEQ